MLALSCLCNIAPDSKSSGAPDEEANEGANKAACSRSTRSGIIIFTLHSQVQPNLVQAASIAKLGVALSAHLNRLD